MFPRKRHQMRNLCDLPCLLTKQVLSQLSYTPTVRVPFILKHFSRFQNPFPRILRQTVPHLLSPAKITSVPKTRQFSMRACHRNRNGTGNLAPKPRHIPLAILGLIQPMREGRLRACSFRKNTWVKQPDRNDDAIRRDGREKSRGPAL